MPIRTWVDSGHPPGRAPRYRPVSPLARAKIPSSQPVAHTASDSWAKATVETSRAPKIAPIRTMSSVRTCRMPERHTAGPCIPVRGAGAGSVERWAARASAPEPASSSPVPMADHGAIATASAVANGGPRTNATSSRVDSSAKAVVSSSGPSATPAQRVRTMAPRFGPDNPASTPRTSHRPIGVPAMTAIVRPVTARMCTPMSGGMTRCWPKRSASRAPTGPPMAPARVMDAATAPAWP